MEYHYVIQVQFQPSHWWHYKRLQAKTLMLSPTINCVTLNGLFNSKYFT